MNWSKQQKAAFGFIDSSTRSLIIEAVAGSGKTTTIVEIANRLPSNIRCIFLAFNKAIAETLKSRLPNHIPASTMHSLGYRALARYLNTSYLKMDQRKTWGIISENMAPDQQKIYGTGIRQLVSLAKGHGIVPATMEGVTALTLDTEQNWVDLLEKYDVEFEGGNPLQGIKYAQAVLLESIKIGQQLIDFDDMLYLPTIWQARFEQYPVVITDEAQDMNLIQRAILRMSLAPGGRLIAVGDANQAIYGFRGADTEAIANIKADFDADSLPLSVSYRCPKNIVREARRYVKHIEPAESAPDGNVRTLGQYDQDEFDPQDAIICRNTAPLIEMAFSLLRCGKACKIMGREIGQGLTRLIQQVGGADMQSLEELELALDKHFARESQKLLAKGREEAAAMLEDRILCIKIFISRMPEKERTVTALANRISQLFADSNGGLLTLATVHRAKGLEWDHVYILEPGLMPSRYARQVWQMQQERNIAYVAITRAKSSLTYIEMKGFTEVI